MSKEQFKWLFTPGKIGKLEIKNRVCNACHTVNYAEFSGEMNQRYIDYVEERAKNGVGLLFTEGSNVDGIRGKDVVRQSALHLDEFIPQLHKMADAAHKYGAKIGMQIVHPGRQGDTKWTGYPTEAPSPIPCPIMQNPPEEMTVERIREVVKLFGEAALRLKKATFDIAEIHAAHGYLVNEFMSPYSNKRTDQYGGSFENRARFALEVIKEVREQVGPDFTVGIRISGDEFVEGGLTLEDQKEFAKAFEAAGVDYIHVTAGVYAIPGVKMIVQPMELPLAVLQGLAAGIREVVNIPVIQVGRVNDPVLAEQMLESGSADFIAMNRALIADPEMLTKTAEGRLDDIRKCVACNQGCIDRMFSNLDASCTINPATGREREYVIKPAEKKKKVMVIGGGPAGLECARVAALRGHNVSIYDERSELGGMNLYAKKLPGRDEFGGVSRYLSQQVEKLGVKINLGQRVTPETVKGAKPDAVIVATGATFAVPFIKGARAANGGLADNVLTPLEVLDGAPVGDKVVVYGANTIGLEVACLLKEQGKQVTVVERSAGPVEDMYGFIAWYGVVLPKVQELGIEIKVQQLVKEILPGEVVLDQAGLIAPDQNRTATVIVVEERLSADTVVLAVGREPNNSLLNELIGLAPEVYPIGDCCEAAVTYCATHDGAWIGRKI